MRHSINDTNKQFYFPKRMFCLTVKPLSFYYGLILLEISLMCARISSQHTHTCGLILLNSPKISLR